MTISNQSQMPDLLNAVTEALLKGQNIDDTLTAHNAKRADIAAFISLIFALHKVLVGVKPSRRFAHRLKQDLMGAPRMNVISRIRYLPPRVQIAAGLALVAGFMLITRRRLLADTHEDAVREIEVVV